MEDVFQAVVNLTVPGLGPIAAVLRGTKLLWNEIDESAHCCESLQHRFEVLWMRVQELDATARLPPKFRPGDYAAALERFHTCVQRHHDKTLLLRIGTVKTFLQCLRCCHEELDQLFELLELEHLGEMASWRAEWEQEAAAMGDQLSAILENGRAIREELREIRHSAELLTLLAHEEQRHRHSAEPMPLIRRLRDKLSKEHHVPLPRQIPPWFFTFDDITFDSEPFRPPSKGSSGTVHRGRWGVSTPVVVKQVPLPIPPMADGTTFPTWKEADVWWTLNHPNVLRMFGACHLAQPAFIVCEEAGRGNVRDYVHADPSHRRRLWRLVHDAGVGLAHLRDRNVVHGNLKVTNILVGDDLRAKISDFGFSVIHRTLSESPAAGQTPIGGLALNAMSWQAPELVAAAERGEVRIPTFESDVFAFAICILELLAQDQPWGNDQFLARFQQDVRRPRDIGDDEWELIKRMTTRDPTKRPTIHQVVQRLRWIADAEEVREARMTKNKGASPPPSMPASEDVDEQRREHARGRAESMQQTLEELRLQIREEERQLERVLDRRRHAEQDAGQGDEHRRAVHRAKSSISSTLTTKQLLRTVKWGLPEEQMRALEILDGHPRDHSAAEILRGNGLELLIACIKHGHSTEFRQLAMNLLQSVTTTGGGVYIDAVLEHGLAQVLMGILHYRNLPMEQRRAAQFILALSVRSSRARSFIMQNNGMDLIIKLLWQAQISLMDAHIRKVCDPQLLEEMQRFLTTQAEIRAHDGDLAFERSNRELALQKLTEAIVLHPKNGRYFARRSEIYATLRKYDHAARDALQCIKRLPEYGEGYYRHAIALYGQRQHEQARRAVKLGRQRDPYYFTKDRLEELDYRIPRDTRPTTPRQQRRQSAPAPKSAAIGSVTF